MVAVACAAFTTVAGGAGCSGGSSGHGAAGGSGHQGAGVDAGGAGGTTAAGGGAGGSAAGGATAIGTGGEEAPSTDGGGGTPTGGALGGTAGAAAGGAGGMAAGGCLIPSGPSGTWVEVPPPPDQSGFNAMDAFAVGPDDFLFAGMTVDPTGKVASTDARLLRWTRGCWTVELTIPPSTVPPDFPSVHGTGPDDLWASAADLLYHRDAQGWTQFADETWRNQVGPPPFGDPAEFHRVRAGAPNDVWVAEDNNLLHWTGQSWTAYNFDSADYPNSSGSIGYYVFDILIDSATSVWAAGPSDQVGNTMDLSFVHHFDGAGWTHTAVSVGEVDAIWRAGPILWLAAPSIGEVTLFQFDGTTLNPTAIAGFDPTQQAVYLTSLFGHGASDVWAAGQDVAHFDGQGWSLAADAPAAARGDRFTNTLVTGDAASVWLATIGPHFFRRVTSP